MSIISGNLPEQAYNNRLQLVKKPTQQLEKKTFLIKRQQPLLKKRYYSPNYDRKMIQRMLSHNFDLTGRILDTNSDGYISKEEFENKYNPEVLNQYKNNPFLEK